MTEEKTFEPITSQAEFDERIKGRLAREREKWAKDSGAEDLKAELQAKEEEISAIKQERHREAAERALRAELAGSGVEEEGRIARIMKHVDLDAVETNEDGKLDRLSIRQQLADVNRDMPELLTYRMGAGSGGSSKPVLKAEKPLSRDALEQMTPSEVNSNWERIQRFLAGER